MVQKNNNIKILSNILNKGNLEQFFFAAQDYITEKIEANPAINNLIGIYFYKKKNYNKSIEFFDKSINEKKIYEVIANKTASLVALKEFEKAQELYNELILLNPKIPAAYIGLSNIFLLKEDYSASENILLKGLKLNKNNFELSYTLARLYYHVKSYEKAIQFFNVCIEITGAQSDLLNRLALCLEEVDQIENALKQYEKSLSINHYHIDTAFNYGNLLRSLGKFNEAKEIYQKIILKYPFAHESHRYFSIIHKYQDENDKHLVQMLNIIKHENFLKKEESLHQIYFALSKAFEDLKNYKESTKYLKKGNLIRRQSTSFNNIEIARNQFETQKNIFANLNLPKTNGSDSTLPIFILGMPRSGTTLVEQIISSHSKVNSGGELIYISEAIKKFFPEKNLSIFKDNVINNLQKSSLKMSEFYLDKVKTKLKDKKNHLTDKLPNNFTFIGFIKFMFPKSKIIYCKRNKSANCLSIYKNYFPDNGIWFAYEPEELKSFYDLHINYMEFWKKIFPNTIYTLNYESLVNNQVIETKKLIEYCELDWEDSCLKFYENKSKVSTLSTAQVRNPIYNNSIDLYKNYKNFIPELFD